MRNKLIIGFLIALTLCLLFSACDSNERSIEEAKKKITIEEANRLIKETKDFSQSSNMENKLIEITPPDIWDKTKVQMFKDSSFETFIVTNQKAVRIGIGFGGFGVTSAVPYDVNKDGTLDVIYAYSWGSGLHRSVISWIDLKSFTEHNVGDMPERTDFLRMYDLILKIERKEIVVYRIADMDESKINFALLQSSPTQSITLEKDGILVWENGVLYNKS